MKYLIAATLGLFLIGCKKEEPLPHYTIPAEQLDFYNYQVGTYWIMEDSATQARDSFSVAYKATSTSTTTSYVKDQVVITIKQYPIVRSADPSTWTLILGEGRVDLLFKNPNEPDGATFLALSSPPDSTDRRNYVQGGKLYENAYTTSRYYISGADSMHLTSVFNRDSGIIRLKTTNLPKNNFDWRLVESKIVRE